MISCELAAPVMLYWALLTNPSCSDSVLVNGKGSVFCKDPEELTNLMDPNAREVVNATLTDKG